MDKLRIQGGKALHGEVAISGAKNATLPLMAACLLLDGPLVLQNIAALGDVVTMIKLLRQMGVTVEEGSGTQLRFNANTLTHTFAPYEMVRAMRASILVLGPMLARFGSAQVSMPGGCAIGARPVDRHLQALKAMGAEVDIENGYINAQGKLHGAEVGFDDVTVTGTENIMMAAVLAEGETIIHNCAMEPEVVDLATCLNRFGARIEGAGTETICIQGVDRLSGGEHRVIGDRIEAITYLIAAIMTQGNVTIVGIDPVHCKAAIDLLRTTGANITTGEDWIGVNMMQKPMAASVTTAPFPGFPTDAQAQLVALNSIAQGRSVVTETIFENRFMHVHELRRMGGRFDLHHDYVICHGVGHLIGARVEATDLRASASLVLAGLVAQGETIVEHVYHLDRGYLAMEKKLQSLGASIERIGADIL